MKNIFLSLLVIILLSRCGENEGKKRTEVNGFWFEAIAVTDEYAEEENKYTHYVLRMGRADSLGIIAYIRDHQDKKRIFDYLAAGIEQDIFLQTDQGRLPCILSHFERDYGLKPYLKINAYFEVDQDEKIRHLVYRDKAFGLGEIKIDI